MCPSLTNNSRASSPLIHLWTTSTDLDHITYNRSTERCSPDLPSTALPRPTRPRRALPVSPSLTPPNELRWGTIFFTSSARSPAPGLARGQVRAPPPDRTRRKNPKPKKCSLPGPIPTFSPVLAPVRGRVPRTGMGPNRASAALLPSPSPYPTILRPTPPRGALVRRDQDGRGRGRSSVELSLSLSLLLLLLLRTSQRGGSRYRERGQGRKLR